MARLRPRTPFFLLALAAPIAFVVPARGDAHVVQEESGTGSPRVEATVGGDAAPQEVDETEGERKARQEWEVGCYINWNMGLPFAPDLGVGPSCSQAWVWQDVCWKCAPVPHFSPLA